MQADWGIVGLGNPLAGDDGVGCWLAERLRKTFPSRWIHDLGADLLKIQALQPYPKQLILLDALRSGAKPGSLHYLSEEKLLQSPTTAAAHGFGLKGTLGLLRQTDDAFCKIKREWRLIEVEQIHQPFVLSPTVQAGAEQLFKQLTKQLQ